MSDLLNTIHNAKKETLVDFRIEKDGRTIIDTHRVETLQALAEWIDTLPLEMKTSLYHALKRYES